MAKIIVSIGKPFITALTAFYSSAWVVVKMRDLVCPEPTEWLPMLHPGSLEIGDNVEGTLRGRLSIALSTQPLPLPQK